MTAALGEAEPAASKARIADGNIESKAAGSGGRGSALESKEEDNAPEDDADGHDVLPAAVDAPVPPAPVPAPVFAQMSRWCAPMLVGEALAAITSGGEARRAAEGAGQVQTAQAGAAEATAAKSAATQGTERAATDAAASKASAPVSFALAISEDNVVVAQTAGAAAATGTEEQAAVTPAAMSDPVGRTALRSRDREGAVPSVATTVTARTDLLGRDGEGAAPLLCNDDPEAISTAARVANSNESRREQADAVGGAGSSARDGISAPPSAGTRAIEPLPSATAPLRSVKTTLDEVQAGSVSQATDDNLLATGDSALHSTPHRDREGVVRAPSYSAVGDARIAAASAAPDQISARAAARPQLQQTGSALPARASDAHAGTNAGNGRGADATATDAAKRPEPSGTTTSPETRGGKGFDSAKRDAATQPQAAQANPAAPADRTALHAMSQPAPRTEPKAPPAPQPVQSPAATEPPAPPESTTVTQRLREVSIVLPPRENGNGPRVELNIADRGGEVRVAVRTPDPGVRETLRTELPALVDRLQQNGYRAEVVSSGLERSAAAHHQHISRAAAPADAGGRDPMAWNFNDGRHENPSRDPDSEPAARPASKRPQSGDRSFFHEFLR